MQTVKQLLVALLLLTVALLFGSHANPGALSEQIWNKPANWPATPENDRKPYSAFYEAGDLPAHSPSDADDLGLEWETPLRASELAGLKASDFGGVYCPTLEGRKRGGFKGRYRGIHRGHDIGVSSSRLGNKKIPVHVIADGVYDGQRTYTHADALPNDCKPLVVYHFNIKRNLVPPFTSIYCHVDPLPNLQPGQRLKKGDVIGHLEDPKGAWSAHVHLELYSRPVYSSKDSTKFDRCGCPSDSSCDNKTKTKNEIPRGCGIFEDDLYILEPVEFIKKRNGGN